MQNNKTILVIEDERPLLAAIKSKLEKSNFDVVTARTVEQALNYLEELQTVDAIWLDHYLLGKEDGLYFVTKVKGNLTRFKQTPIFVVSNTASPDKEQSYMHLGINNYYVKAEHRLEEIINDIKSILEHPEK